MKSQIKLKKKKKYNPSRKKRNDKKTSYLQAETLGKLVTVGSTIII